MTARRLKGLDALRDAIQADTAAVRTASKFLILDNIPCSNLTVQQFAAVTRLSYKRVLKDIHASRLRVITGGTYVIPVSEIDVVESWADYLNPTA